MPIVTGGVVTVDVAVNDDNPPSINTNTPAATFNNVLAIVNTYESQSGFGMTTLTLDGNSPTTTYEDTTFGEGFVYIAQFLGANLPTQNASVALDLDFDDTPNNGPCVFLVYLDNDDAMDTPNSDAPGASLNASAALTGLSGTDIVIGVDANYDTVAPPNATGWTSQAVHENRDNWSARLRTLNSVTATSTINSEDDYYACVGIVAVPNAGAGGGGSSPIPTLKPILQHIAGMS